MELLILFMAGLIFLCGWLGWLARGWWQGTTTMREMTLEEVVAVLEQTKKLMEKRRQKGE